MKLEIGSRLNEAKGRPPHGGRGLKCQHLHLSGVDNVVAPHTGGVD